MRVATEIVIKKESNGKLRLPIVVSRPTAIAFLVVTALWLFFSSLIRFNADAMVLRENASIVRFINDAIRVKYLDFSM